MSRTLNRLRVRLLRYRTSRTQAQVAGEAGLARATIVALERKGAIPSMDTVDRVAAIYGVSPSVIWDAITADDREELDGARS